MFVLVEKVVENVYKKTKCKMKIVSWNVAGFRACLKKGFEEFFNKEKFQSMILNLHNSNYTGFEGKIFLPNFFEFVRNVSSFSALFLVKKL